MPVLVGYLPTPVGDAALSLGIEEARRRDDSILVLNSAHGGSHVATDLASEHVMNGIRSRLEDSGLEHEVLQHTNAGRDGAEEVLHVAGQRGVSVIVIGLRHRTLTGKYLFGSNAQRILLDADVPVLTVKPSG
ncbi:universal stress protein [Arthrobacter pigmenti]